jgi:hypothetical protein
MLPRGLSPRSWHYLPLHKSTNATLYKLRCGNMLNFLSPHESLKYDGELGFALPFSSLSALAPFLSGERASRTLTKRARLVIKEHVASDMPVAP